MRVFLIVRLVQRIDEGNHQRVERYPFLSKPL
jgi:hypothetical protein